MIKFVQPVHLIIQVHANHPLSTGFEIGVHHHEQASSANARVILAEAAFCDLVIAAAAHFEGLYCYRLP